MTCEQALQRMGEFVDGDLRRSDRFWLRMHLLICRHCRRYLCSYQTTIRAEKNAFGVTEAADAIQDEQVAAILRAIERDDRAHE